VVHNGDAHACSGEKPAKRESMVSASCTCRGHRLHGTSRDQVFARHLRPQARPDPLLGGKRQARADVARAHPRQGLRQAEPTADRRPGWGILPRYGGGAPRQSRRSGRLGSGDKSGRQAQEAAHDASAARHPLPLHVRKGSERIPEGARPRPFGETFDAFVSAYLEAKEQAAEHLMQNAG
jgi:hypothetical protein